ncbi:segregation/condensation protein A [Serpentinicella sp. ANB-PHB4]|uniref:segregation and condensation protein A n=1 Tax=Serpentinicella sp. ANB-PHB4 TaxID=3074076 RepID=UPI0028653E8A|nr:segregation/condensation protein A [Serpentinicella sp. ANB-PHB4]MDR5658164.1 segregation/condensation protein A [Serpentinicella sp. ANB-PHB4]
MAYKIKIEAFEGPFDLLFHLIDKNKVDLYDIPINQITEQYLSYLNKMKQLDLDITSEFLIMAATLIEIKSKMLLPQEKSNLIEEDEEDPREELVRKMVEYKKYKEIAKQFKIREEKNNKVFYKKKEEILIEETNSEDQFQQVEINDLLKAFQKIINSPKSNSSNTSINFRSMKRDTITIEEKMKDILYLLNDNSQISFSKCFSNHSDKIDLITTFLAVLELIKSKKIIVCQNSLFCDIKILSNN